MWPLVDWWVVGGYEFLLVNHTTSYCCCHDTLLFFAPDTATSANGFPLLELGVAAAAAAAVSVNCTPTAGYQTDTVRAHIHIRFTTQSSARFRGPVVSFITLTHYQCPLVVPVVCVPRDEVHHNSIRKIPRKTKRAPSNGENFPAASRLSMTTTTTTTTTTITRNIVERRRRARPDIHYKTSTTRLVGPALECT
uniref:Putative secreted protein n=1 Tax=Anopheles darlingi TaxID=43151 RepID=A0A2M4DCM8_ANODA